MVVKQISGEYRVKNPRMQGLYEQAISQFHQLDSWTFSHAYRDKNDAADKLAKAGREKGKK